MCILLFLFCRVDGKNGFYHYCTVLQLAAILISAAICIPFVLQPRGWKQYFYINFVALFISKRGTKRTKKLAL
jgi:hypothetical protein